jgi:hypothetical protein
VPDLRRKNCNVCHGNVEQVGPISWSGLCERCAVERAASNYLALINHSGPDFNRWRRAIAASVGGVLRDDLREGS